MIKKVFVTCAAVLTAAAGLLSATLSASALTVEEVADEARKYGYPEDTVQYALNEYYSDPDLQNEENLQQAMEAIHGGAYSYLTTAPQQTIVTTTTTTTAAAAPGETTDQSAPVTTTPVQSDGITLTAADGTTFTRISVSAFIAMSYEEKMAYIASFPPVQQQAILNNLTPEEHRSILKQLPTEKKAEVVDNMSQFANTMGLEMTVDEMTDDEMQFSIHNTDGELVGVSSMGVIVEDTGYDRRGIVAAACGLFLIAFAGIAVAVRKCFRRPPAGENDER
ncbi:MAG: hypothetical protein IJM44_07770 [Ruminococcus sp.]|nr:hypothetical protein [Ruminococcus sp.]